MKKAFSNRPWKAWKTRKIVLIGTIIVWLAYVVTSIILNIMGIQLDDTVTNNVFESGKWLVITGCAITIAKVYKGKTNSDSDEPYTDDSIESDDTGDTSSDDSELSQDTDVAKG